MNPTLLLNAYSYLTSQLDETNSTPKSIFPPNQRPYLADNKVSFYLEDTFRVALLIVVRTALPYLNKSQVANQLDWIFQSFDIPQYSNNETSPEIYVQRLCDRVSPLLWVIPRSGSFSATNDVDEFVKKRLKLTVDSFDPVLSSLLDIMAFQTAGNNT